MTDDNFPPVDGRGNFTLFIWPEFTGADTMWVVAGRATDSGRVHGLASTRRFATPARAYAALQQILRTYERLS